MSSGKDFENDLKKSVPNNVFYLRMKDTGGWAKSETTRFSSFNIADCILFDGYNLFLLELKSHKGKSIPLNCIRDKQVEGLTDACYHHNLHAGLLVNFADVEETYFLPIGCYSLFTKESDRKSIPIDYFREFGVKLESEKKKVHYTYSLSEFLEEFKNHRINDLL